MTASNGFEWTDESWGPGLRSPALGRLADHLFTTCQLRLRGQDEDADWERVACAVGLPTDRLLRVRQVHGNRAAVVRPGSVRWSADGGRPEADIVASDDPDIAVAVQVADCVPLLMAGASGTVVAAVHAGWRGTAANAAATGVALLATEFGVEPGDLVVAQGPSIGPCCYTVGPELVEQFEAAGFGASVGRWFQQDPGGRWRLDLWTANMEQLVAAGVRPDAIRVARLCTACHPELFHSYRRDGAGTGRIAAVVRPSRRLDPSPGSPGGRPRY